jgi:hypothetical protein
MADNVKVKITEKNGVELDFTEEYDLIAENIPYDPSDSGLTATDVKAGLDELSTNIATSASPGFSWGRSGNLSTNTWLQNEGVSSNRAGRTVTFSSPEITRIFTASEDLNTYTITIYEHEGDSINLTALTTLSATASRTADSGTISVTVTQGRQLAIRITSGSAKNLVVGMTLAGENS